jgi:hypothetical protein
MLLKFFFKVYKRPRGSNVKKNLFFILYELKFLFTDFQ